MLLLDNFHDLTVNPSNASKLKDFVLQLAVQGKLTEEWRNANLDVEPASVLLERIKEEKEQLVREVKIKKQKPLPPIMEKEIPYDLPQGWEWCRLGEITHNFGQKKPEDRFTYIDVGSIDNKKGVISNDYQILEANNAPSRARKIVHKGCVIYSTVRPYLLNISIVDRDFEPEPIVSTAFAVLQPLASTSEMYLFNYLKSPDFTEYVEYQMIGVAYPAINDGKLMLGLIPLPPLQEQHQIVAKVNQLLSQIEQLETQTQKRIQLKKDFATASLHQLTNGHTRKHWPLVRDNFHEFFNEVDNIKKLKETILQLAVQGKLTTGWRKEHSNVEPGSVLLERIKKEKDQLVREGKIKKQKPLLPITEEELPYELPEGWEWCRLQEVFDIRDGTHDSPKSCEGSDSFPLVTSKDFKNGSINFATTKRISKNDYEEIKKRSFVEKDDILFSMIGGNIGNQVVVREKSDFAIKNVALFKYYNRSLTEPRFLKIFSEYIAFSLQNKALGGAQPFVSLKFLRHIVFPLPPLEEQHRVANKVDELIRLCDNLENQAQKSVEQLEDLILSVLKRSTNSI